ncbi:MAG: hypothetical protein GEU86_11145 [Actinophytocola sp.]|nr:hypothetical protein [Actinophytocola sp.]
MTNEDKPSTDAMHGRRALLTRGGAVLAGVAGAGVASAITAPAANAAPGDAVIQGSDNDAEATTTGLTSTSSDATLDLSNGNTANVAPLRLAPVATPSANNVSAQSRGGDLFNYDGELVMTHFGQESGVAEPHVGFAHTSYWSNTMVTIEPQRVLDTRDSATHDNIVNKAGNLDSKGRLIAGKAIRVRLDGLVNFGDAVNANLTVVKPLANGYASITPENPGAAPSTSSINYVTNQIIGNFAVAPIGWEEGESDGIWDYVYLFTYATTHLVLDVSGFAVPHVSMVNPPAFAALGAQHEDKQAKRRQMAAEHLLKVKGQAK